MVDQNTPWRNRIATCGFALIIATLASERVDAESGPLAPKRLLVYYGYPSAINGAPSTALAAAQFANYDHVVLGDGLQDGPGDPSPHPDHASTMAILAHPAANATKFYGYVDLGVTTQNLSITEIRRRVNEWDAMGVTGVLLDDFGYDFGVSRARQNDAVNYVHSRGLVVIANGFFVDDLYGIQVNINNPTSAATLLNANDYYLYESHQYIEGSFQPEQVWLDKADALRQYQEVIGFGIFSITTNSLGNSFDPSGFHYSWFSAAMYGHDATGWGEYLFSASGISNSMAMFRMRPDVDIGTAFLGEKLSIGSAHGQRTDRGVIIVDADDYEAAFLNYGDANGDGHVRLNDLPTLKRCLLGPTQPATPPNCTPRHFAVVDADADDDVDLHDWWAYQNSFTG